MKAKGKGMRNLVRYGLTITILALITGGGFFILSTHTLGKEDLGIETAPVNPEFQKYLQDRDAGLVRTFTEDGYPLGEIPPIVDARIVKISRLTLPDHALPRSYSSLDEGYMTTVKDQGTCGSCWAFASYASTEANYMKNYMNAAFPDLAKEPDWSEKHLIKNHNFDYGECDGGNQYMSGAYLARWDGPLNEKDEPYDHGVLGKKGPQRHIQNIVYVPPKTSARKDKHIKDAIKKYGAGYVSMYWSNSCYNPSTYAYYNKNLEVGAHGVCVVGWDDNFSKDNFLQKPPGNGAYIVKNSWGENWGDDGYFYVSYYDNYFCKRSHIAFFLDKTEADTDSFLDNEPVSNYKRVYQYDPYGWVNNIGWGSKVLWIANVFKAKKNETLKAVSLYSVDTLFKYVLYIYTDVDNNGPTNGTLALKMSGKFKSPGYFTIPIKNISIKKGQRFAIVFKIKTKTHSWPGAVEYYDSGYCSKANAKAGESWISKNGIDWVDLTKAYKSSANFCIKAFAK